MGLKRLWFCLVSAAAFFVTYDCTKSLLGAGGPLAAPHVAPVAHMLAASLGEIVSLSAPSPSRLLFDLCPSTLLLACLLPSFLPSFLHYFIHSFLPCLTTLFSLCVLPDFTDHYAELASGGGRVVLAVGSELQLGASSGPSLLPVDLPSSGPQTLPIESVGFRPVTSSGAVSSIHPIRITVEYRF